MDLIDRLRDIASRIPAKLQHLQTEEATKTALVMPLINALGYNVFDPSEVVPEFTADVGTKKGEKVDYAILQEGKPIILIECKTANANLDEVHASQLFRYFSVTAARFGVLTNGVAYRIFSDIEEPNKMDSRPFLEFDMLDLTDHHAEELKKFMKESFDLDKILSTASELKYTKGIVKALAEEWLNPSGEFVRLFTARVYSGRLTQSVREQFTQITKRAFHNFVSNKINDRLKTALEGDSKDPASVESTSPDPDTASGGNGEIVTTEEEYEGYYIVKSILREIIDVRRIYFRDTKRYCGILLDDSNRKPICRMWFNTSQKYLGVFDEVKNETKHAIDDVDGIYRFADAICETVKRHDESGLSSSMSQDHGSSDVSD